MAIERSEVNADKPGVREVLCALPADTPPRALLLFQDAIPTPASGNIPLPRVDSPFDGFSNVSLATRTDDKFDKANHSQRLLCQVSSSEPQPGRLLEPVAPGSGTTPPPQGLCCRVLSREAPKPSLQTRGEREILKIPSATRLRVAGRVVLERTIEHNITVSGFSSDKTQI